MITEHPPRQRPPRTAWTAEMSGYYTGGARAGQVRKVHLIPPDGTFPGRTVPAAACGQTWWDVTNADRERVPTDQPLPAGLVWCPRCMGVAAERLGLIDQVAALVLAAVAHA